MTVLPGKCIYKHVFDVTTYLPRTKSRRLSTCLWSWCSQHPPCTTGNLNDLYLNELDSTDPSIIWQLNTFFSSHETNRMLRENDWKNVNRHKKFSQYIRFVLIKFSLLLQQWRWMYNKNSDILLFINTKVTVIDCFAILQITNSIKMEKL